MNYVYGVFGMEEQGEREERRVKKKVLEMY